MSKFPKWAYFLVFVLLFCLSMAFMLIFQIIFSYQNQVKISQIEYYFLYSINTIISLIAGGCFIKILRAWTPGEMAERMNNIFAINNAIISLQKRKTELRSKVKDWVYVSFSDYEIKEINNE